MYAFNQPISSQSPCLRRSARHDSQSAMPFYELLRRLLSAGRSHGAIVRCVRMPATGKRVRETLLTTCRVPAGVAFGLRRRRRRKYCPHLFETGPGAGFYAFD